MLFSVDSLYGHIIEDTPDGPVYKDDRSPVDEDKPRPCFGCGLAVTPGGHDPCIANLPGTYQACCGHGLDKTPHGNLNGYAALRDGRCIRFSGCQGGQRIREAVAAVLGDQPLPDGFEFDNDRAWWTGLTDAQVAHVRANVIRGLTELVTEAKNGESPSELFLKGEAMWWDGLDETQKAYVWERTRAMMAKLVQEALQQVPA